MKLPIYIILYYSIYMEIGNKMAMDMDIKVKTLEYKPHDGIDFSELKLELSGNDMDISLVNSFRRTCEKNIPILAFPRGLIKIIKNTVVAYDNDYMKQRLRFLPIFNNNLGLDPKLDYLPEKYWKGMTDIDYFELSRPIHPAEKKLEILMDVVNNTNDILYFNTNHKGFQIFIDNLKVPNESIYNKEFPCLIIPLRPKEAFICSMTAALGTGNENHKNQWNSCTNTHHHYEGDIEIPAIVELRACALLDSYDICIRACNYMIIRCEYVKKIILNKCEAFDDMNGQYEIILENEDSTMGEFLNSEFQKIDNFISGVMIPDKLVKSVTIKQEMIGDTSVKRFKKIVDKVFLRAVARLETLKNKINKDNKNKKNKK